MRETRISLWVLGALAAGLLACGTEPSDTPEGGDTTPGVSDSGDTGPIDTDPGDAGPEDPEPSDGGQEDPGPTDGGQQDPEPADGGSEDPEPGDTQAPTVAGGGLSFTAVGYDAVTVSWNAATDDQTDAGALSYRLVRAASAAAIDTVAEAAAVQGYAVALDWFADSTSVRVEGLGSGAEYWFAVLVRDEAENLALYPLGQVRLQDVSAPHAPSVTLWCLGYDSVWVTWEPAYDAGGGPLEYKLVLADAREAIDTPAEVDAISGAGLVMDWQDASAHLLTGLAPATTHYVALLVRDSAGLLSWVYPLEVTTTDTTAPTPGTAIEVVGEPTETSAQLRWGAASELQVEYRVAVATDLASVDTLLEVSTAPGAYVIPYSTSLTLSELAPATRYWAAVMVKDVFGFAALYEPVTFHTPDRNPPTAGSPITFPEQGEDWVRLTWGAAVDETAPERLEYKVVWSFIPEEIDTTWEVRVYEGRSVSDVVVGGVVLDWTPGVTSAVATGQLANMKHFAVLVRDVGPYPDDPSTDALRGHALYGPAAFPPVD